MAFAKIFETTLYGQILVLKTTDEETNAPVVSFSVEPEGYGICATKVSFSDDDAGYDKRDKFFNDITEENANELISPIFVNILKFPITQE